ncbi:MAG: hypothetical protein M0C28_49170 [Candidatus Moduliflexus flocculans]|nr:hypothetical protein [Candidatus Moduliflexus flocculans]
MRLKTKVIVNPESNRGRTRKRWGEIREGLKHFIREFKFEFTEKPLHATDLAREAIKDGTELVIGVGGDGTMNEIANGFYEDRRIINPEATLGLVPSGTGCDLIKSLNIPAGPSRRPARSSPTPRPCAWTWAGSATARTPAARKSASSSTSPISASAARSSAEVTERRLQRKASSYVRCLVTTMVRYRNKRVRIRVDGRDLPDGEYLIGAVANGRIFGKGMKVAPDARLDDGLFDAVLVRGFRFLEFCRHGWKLMNGSHVTHPKVSVVRGRQGRSLARRGRGRPPRARRRSARPVARRRSRSSPATC